MQRAFGNDADFAEMAPGLYEARLLDSARAGRIAASILDAPGWLPAAVVSKGVSNVESPAIRISSTLSERAGGANAATIRRKVIARSLDFIATFGQRFLTTSRMQFVRYTVGGFYRVHRDFDPSATRRRLYTILCYLNDDFEGGHTTFPKAGLSVAPSAGKTLVFDSSLLHGADAVIAGQKLVVVTWCVDAPLPISDEC
jgi:predicted 2-oxoglutarate/Fe(II)-dependent dioxygenase YbiX